MKSSKVGKNHRRRQLILNALMPLPFKIFSVCIDKRLCLENMNAQGLKYKTSFYKFMNNIVHKELRRAFQTITIIADEIGGSDYMPDVLRCSLTMPLDKRPAEIGSATVPVIQTNAKTVPFNTQPTMLWSENDLLNCLLNTYAVMQYRYHTGKITHEKYFEWKLQWSFGSTITHSSPLSADIEALLQSEAEE